MYEELINLGISINLQTQSLLNEFSQYFLLYNKNVNLISNNDSQLLFPKHIYDSLAFNLFYEKYKINYPVKILDIGTGGGFPSIPLSLFYKNINVFALDSINKKINFIKSAAEKFHLANLTPICSRVENLDNKYKNSFDIVTTRAMAELRIVLEYGIPFIKKGGYFIAYKSIKADEELNNAQNALKILNSKLIDVIEYNLPIKDENKRVLLVIRKEKDIPSCYPRSNGLVKKKPL